MIHFVSYRTVDRYCNFPDYNDLYHTAFPRDAV